MFGVWGSIGYSGMMHNLKGSKIPSGVAPTIGVGYRFYRNGMILQTGVEGQYAWMKCVMPFEVHQQRMLDADANREPFMMTATVSDRRENYTMMNVQVPLYLGYEKEYWYVLAGVTVGLNVYGKATSWGTMTTQAAYERLIGVMEGMPNHGLTKIDVESGERSFRTNTNMMAHVEAGGRLDKANHKKGFKPTNHLHRLYLGVFVDYGFLNVNKNISEGDLLKLDFTNGVNASIAPLMTSTQMLQKRINPLVVGIKFTALFELPKHGKSYIYDYQKVNSGFIKRGANQSMQ